jgi:hypothetical protein
MMAVISLATVVAMMKKNLIQEMVALALLIKLTN